MKRKERIEMMINALYNLVWDKVEELVEHGLDSDDASTNIDYKIYKLIARQIAKELNIEIPRIIVVDNMDSRDYGYYDNDTNTIALNRLLSPAAYIMLGEVETAMEHMSTLVHELRHKYQWTYNPSILDNYVSPDEDMEAYKNHPSEIDAREYQAQWNKNDNHLRVIDVLINKL